MLAISGNNKLTEESTYERARYYSKKGEWENAETAWFEYVSNKAFRSNSPEAWYRLATARDKRGKIPEALNAYLQNVGKYPQYIEFSIPANARCAVIQKNAGELKKAFDFARLGGLRFAKYINDSRFSTEFATMRSIYSDYADQFAKEENPNPYE